MKQFVRKYGDLLVIPVLAFFSWVVIEAMWHDLPQIPLSTPVALPLIGVVCFTIYFIHLCQVAVKYREVSIILVCFVFIYLFYIIGSFAVAYMHLGLSEGGSAVSSPSACLYFSAVTFTTLGYGDLVPTEASRFLAVLEALLGYMLLGTFAAVIYGLLFSKNRA